MQKKLEYVGAKPMTYHTRRLMAGDEIECSGPHARAWLATKKFREARPLADIPPPPAELLADLAGDDLAALRAEYAEKLGKRPFNGWGADVLREKIADA